MKKTPATGKSTTTDRMHSGFTAEERAAMRERSREAKAASEGKEGGLTAVLEKIANMHETDRLMAEWVHAILMESVPDFSPRLWYGMPAYAKDGKVICHFQDAAKFKMRYATLGFSDKAELDDGSMWSVAYALTEMTPDVEAKIITLAREEGRRLRSGRTCPSPSPARTIPLSGEGVGGLVRPPTPFACPAAPKGPATPRFGQPR